MSTELAQKGRLGDVDGYLLSYTDLCTALRVPDDSWLTRIEDGEPHMILHLVFKSDIRFSRNMMAIKKAREKVILRHKDALAERCGIPIDTFLASPLLRAQGNYYYNLWNLPTPHLYTLLDKIYFFFNDDPCLGTETVVIKNEAWEQR